MHELTQLIKSDMKPALGVTEPGAIAFAVSTAKSYLTGDVKKVLLRLNSGMYKNAFTCGIPGSSHVGISTRRPWARWPAGRKRGSLADVTEADNAAAERMVDAGMVEAKMTEITSRIFIEATVTTDSGEAVVTIRDSHTNIVRVTVNGETVLQGGGDKEAEETKPLIHSYTLEQLYEYITTVDAEEIQFIGEA